ncbi:MAG: hypothetical protein HW388_1470 [Dehalococcoidia bacterium]|nr:hypothetical protein [Dehalococcoidia bacterium]
MLTPSRDNPRLQALLLQLPAGLRQHIERVREKALELAKLHGVDTVKAEVAALAHDLARGMEEDELLRRARAYGLTLHPVEEVVTFLLHGPVGAEMLQRECGIEDDEVLEAVRWHTTFNRGMGPVAKVVFLADKLEPHKVQVYPLLEGVVSLAREDMDAALLTLLQEEIISMIRLGRLIHPASLEGRNELLASQKDSRR